MSLKTDSVDSVMLENKVLMLTAKQQSLFKLVQNMYDLSTGCSNDEKTMVTRSDKSTTRSFLTRIKSLEKVRQEFIEVTDQLNLALLAAHPKSVVDFAQLLAFDELYCHIKAVETELTCVVTTKTQQTNNNFDVLKRKLPALELVSFDGSPNKWVVFYENFTALIHNNTNLSDAEKVQYLIGKLSGKALSVCAGIPPIASNYAILWNTLKDKYQDKRTLATMYLEQILNFKGSQIPSTSSLDAFLEHFCAAQSALKQLGIDDLSDFIFTHLAISKLDKETVNLFEQAHRDEKLPKFESLSKFIKEQSKIHMLRNTGLPTSRAASTYSNKPQQTKYIPQYNKPRSPAAQTFVAQNVGSNKNNNFPKCAYCKNDNVHPLYRCEAFLKLNAPARNNFVRSNNLCPNCLGFHSINSCRSYNRCTVCNRMHHTQLHIESANAAAGANVGRPAASSRPLAAAACDENDTYAPPSAGHAHAKRADLPIAQLADSRDFQPFAHTDQGPNHTMHDGAAFTTTRNANNTTVLLPTAVVYVYNDAGERLKMRVFLDSGSMSHFITKSCCDRLNINITHAPSEVRGIGLSVKPAIGFAKFTIHSRFDARCSYTIHARVMDTITDKMPNANIDTSELNHLRNLPLADDDFYAPADIDCLISNELFPFLLGSRKITYPGSSVVGVETSLGYVVMGRADCVPYPYPPRNNNHAYHAVIEPTLENLTQRFWELESVPTKKHLSPDDEACERIFKNTVSRDNTGRYTVALPFKYEPTELGRSDNMAKTRLLHLEKRLNANPDLRKDYNATIQDYIEKGYLNKVDNPAPGPCYYIPHHAVYRPDKATTKTRIVLDASCKTSSNKSLNDVLYTGPNLQTNIFDLLINLRLFPIALSADIEKMFFQLKLDENQTCFQRILFRFNSNEPISTYAFSRVAFGISSSPYLAMRVVRQLADDERTRWPAAAWAAERHFFMDDYVSSVSTVSEAEQLFHELTHLFKAGGFNLVKWVTNSTELIKRIPIDKQAPDIVKFDEDNNIKIIGLQWKPHEDYFFFKVNYANHAKCTKRNILSVAARLFDPLSLLGPVTALLKLLVQECWKRNLDWDDDVPADIADQWSQFQNELHALENIKIPRHVGIFQNSRNISLIGFADASEKCYGASIYLRVSQGESDVGEVILLCAKSKVASSNNIVTLPRLELCAALLLSNLIVAVRDSVSERIQINEIIAFSDSTITLSWIRAPPFRFQTFVANRISAINENLPARHWFHIPGNENPADIISRPVMPSKLADNRLWFHGPTWLALPLSEWPIQTYANPLPVIELPEIKLNTFAIQTAERPDVLYDLAYRMSKWNKYLHAVVYVLRFAKILKSRNEITVYDLEIAQTYIIRSIQKKHFRDTNIPALQKLNVFIDKDNLIRVGGRLNNAQLNYTQRHPIVLPANDPIVHLLVDHSHIVNSHAGPSLLLALLRQNYWILSARNMLRKRLRNCNACFKVKPKNTCPLMGDLPHFRVSEVKSFVFTGVDYAGPFYVTPHRRRGVKSVKAYLCLFVCLTTKALHLELVSDLSSEMFLAAFKRFISRRGPVSMILSDGGTNFVGAKRKLDELHSLLTSNTHNKYLDQKLSDLRIQFKRNPPLGSHFGGIYESNIKSVKTHLKRSIGNQILTYEELNTVLVQIEGILNSRPLCVLSSDPNELEALTPSHFLNITPLKYLPAQDVLNTPENRLTRYELLNKLVQTYWHRWRVEYLTSLQNRQKWNVTTEPIQKGQIVIIRDDNAPVLSWPIAVVEELYPGRDQITRVARVKTKTGSYVRPVVKLYRLPLQ